LLGKFFPEMERIYMISRFYHNMIARASHVLHSF
jgi:hypothetical protein